MDSDDAFGIFGVLFMFAAVGAIGGCMGRSDQAYTIANDCKTQQVSKLSNGTWINCQVKSKE